MKKETINEKTEKKEPLKMSNKVLAEEKWKQHLEAVIEFYQKNNRLPKKDEEINGLQVGIWLKNQRSYYRRKTLKEDRAEQLNQNLPGWNESIRKKTEKEAIDEIRTEYLPYIMEEPARADTAFRYDAIWCTGFRNVFDVVMYEIFELHNIEMLEYIKKEHCKRKLQCKLIDEAIKYISSADNEESKKKSLLDSEKIRRIFVNKILDIITAATGVGVNYCLWLSDKETIKENYEKFIKTDFDIDEYYISSAVIVDKGKEGKLYAYEEYPVPLVKVIPIE